MRLLRKGTRGKDVKTLQKLLNQIGNRLVADGIFGHATEDAVINFQHVAALEADGLVGEQTWQTLLERTTSTSSPEDEEVSIPQSIFDTDDFLRRPTWDSHTDHRIKKLHQKVQANVKKLIILLEENLGKTVRVTSGFRSFAEQDVLFAQGRSKPGPKVTNVRAGGSYHNYGLAIDVVEIKHGKAKWNNPDWEKIGELGEQLGFEWGGRWVGFTDRPHFQMTFGKMTSELQQLFESGQRDGDYVHIE
jgi:peptidoglycan L-alanyl-D-glutamate endopeptidase CwlK